jgi:hypothetical protein
MPHYIFVLACPLCNRYKSDKTTAIDPKTHQTVPLFNPRTQAWAEHFCWSVDGLRIIGLTPVGRATVTALHLSDDPDALTVLQLLDHGRLASP